MSEMAAGSDRVPVQVRLPRELVKRLDHYLIDREMTRTAYIEQLIRAALRATEGGG